MRAKSVRFRTDRRNLRCYRHLTATGRFTRGTIARGISGGFPSTRTGFDGMSAYQQNYLLRTMSAADFALLEPHLTPVEIAKHDELALPESRIKYAWFPLSGIISVVAATESGIQAEVGIVGREGMISVATLNGVDFEMMHIFSQMSGEALRIPAATLRQLLIDNPGLHNQLLGYAQNFMLQVASSALAYATQTIEARLSRWLLMCLDRLETSEITMTHEAFALMLGVRRAGVTVAVQGLEGKGAVKARRAALTVINRDILHEIAGDSYGSAERAYERVVGIKLREAGARGTDGAAGNGAASPAE